VQSIKELPATLRDKMVSIIKAYQDSKAGSERGAVGRNVKQGNEPQPEKFGRKGLAAAPTPPAKSETVNPDFKPVEHDEYANAVKANPQAATLTDPDAMQNNHKFSNGEGVYYSISPEGDLQGLVNNSGKKGAIKAATEHAIAQGGKTLDAWDLYLPKQYEKYGFERTERVPYDVSKYGEPSQELKDAWKAQGWKEGDEYPAVQYMRLKGTQAPTPISDQLIKTYGTTDDPAQAGFILPDGRMVKLSGEHDQMVTNAAKKANVPVREEAGTRGPREQVITDENAIRTRIRQTKAGKEVVFSIPDKVTQEQATALQQSAAKLGQYGNVVIEQGKAGGDSKQGPATAGNVQTMLETLGARPKGEVVAEAKAKYDAAMAAKEEELEKPLTPQPVYIDRKSGLHEVVTGPAADRIGHLTASDVPSEKEGEPSTEVRVSSHWVSGEQNEDGTPKYRGKGIGASQLETLAHSLADSGKTALLSDTKMTDSAKGAWKRLMSQYPTAVTEADGGYRFDLEKLKSPAVTKTTSQVKGSTVSLMNNPLKVKVAKGAEAPSTVDVAKALNAYTKRNLGALQPGSESAEMVARATELAEDEARYQMAQNNSGTTWYTEQMDEHDAVAKEMRPALKDDTKLSLFKFAEAILSSGQKPYRNFTATMEAWDHYAKDGKFPLNNPETDKPWGPRGSAGYGNALDAVNRLVEERGEKGAVDWMMSEHPVSELKQYNKNVAGKKTDLQTGVQILGPKRGPFAQNLHGQETAFTADMWVSRTWNRWMGSIETDPESGEITSDSPRNQQERALMKQSFADVANKLSLTMSSLQAVLWYYEQALYTAHGTPKESWSFSDAARRAQAEEKAKAPEATAPTEAEPKPENQFGPRPGEEKRRNRDVSFNPEDFEEK